MNKNFTFKDLASQGMSLSFPVSTNRIKKALLFFLLLQLSYCVFSQTGDSVRAVHHFSGAVSVTNNGISVIPTFSLGKPAAILNMSVGNSRLSFDPELRFSLDGKPWSFIFWGHYKLVNSEKFQVNVGAHPAISFKRVIITRDDKPKETLTRRHYLAGEFAPNYSITKNISVGTYYLYSHGLDQYATKNTHFVAARSSLTNIRLSKQFFMRLSPQFYYLKLDQNDGFYVSSGLTLSRKNFPVAVSAFVNKTIQTNIPGSKDLVWNATLTYSFNKRYARG